MVFDRLDTIGKTGNHSTTRPHQIVDLDRLTLKMPHTHIDHWNLMTWTLHYVTMKTKNKEGSAAVAEASKFKR